MQIISDRQDGEKHCRYYESLLLYRAYNPDIKVDKITPIEASKIRSIEEEEKHIEEVKKRIQEKT